MNQNLIAYASVDINASPELVWKALTDPAMIKEYLFGTDTKSDWKPGSPITFSGEWQGKSYQDKGVILEAIPSKKLKYTYWSSMSGTEDIPENYANVNFEIEGHGSSSKLNLVQDNCKTEEGKKHSEQNWQMVLGKMKELLESKKQ